MENNITVTISTKNRYDVLQHALVSIALQSLKPEKLIIFDDNDEPADLREHDTFKNIFHMLADNGIDWEVVFGKKAGQVQNHQLAIGLAETEFIFRCDDDHVLQPNVLERLHKSINQDKVGAVGGLVYHPGRTGDLPPYASSRIEDIRLGSNVQWYRQPGRVFEVDHLYSTFLYRKQAASHGYDPSLSRIGHREETIFTYTMKRKGWKILVDSNAITWHFQAEGGIRSYNQNREFWEHDEQVFDKYLHSWGVHPTKVKFIALDSGIGDHLAFRQVLPEILKKYKDHRIIMSVCYPEIFEDYLDKVHLISIVEGHHFTGNMTEEHNIYKYLWEQSDKGRKIHLVDAYREFYL